MKQYETVIGLEVHVELATKTKIFCGCSTAFGAPPNAHACPVCTGMPGSLPVLNKKAVEYAAAVGLAAECEISSFSRFDRKNYFYPDNPQNYQISQLYEPLCRNGRVEIETESGRKYVGIHEIHLEEDAGKLVHDEWEDISLVDYNRSGVPLIEIVSEPDMRSASEAIAYLEKLRMIIQYLGASDCRLQEGSMRADVNISVRETGSPQLGTRTEMKNLNSFRAITRAAAHETQRQISLLESGAAVIQETRRWDDAKGCSYAMRSKEDAKDYRYFPEPDLVPVVISTQWLEQIRAAQPELRDERMRRYKKQYGLPDYDAAIVTSSRQMADLFEKASAICGKPKKVANWLMGETMRLLKESGKEPDEWKLDAGKLAKLVNLADSGDLSNTAAKEVFEELFYHGTDPQQYAEEKGMRAVSDEETLRSVIGEVIRSNPKSVQDYRGGKEKVMGFLVGQTMKAMKGRANPGMVNQLLKELLQQ